MTGAKIQTRIKSSATVLPGPALKCRDLPRCLACAAPRGWRLSLFHCLLFDTANTVYMLGAVGPLNTRAQFSTAHAMSDCDCAQRLLHKCLYMGLAPLQTHTTLTDRAEKLSQRLPRACSLA